jgi:hypothetical protein
MLGRQGCCSVASARKAALTAAERAQSAAAGPLPECQRCPETWSTAYRRDDASPQDCCKSPNRDRLPLNTFSAFLRHSDVCVDTSQDRVSQNRL